MPIPGRGFSATIDEKTIVARGQAEARNMIKVYCDVCRQRIQGTPPVEKVNDFGQRYHLCQACIDNEWFLLAGEEMIDGRPRRAVVPVNPTKPGSFMISRELRH
jgi:hypothetical protein